LCPAVWIRIRIIKTELKIVDEADFFDIISNIFKQNLVWEIYFMYSKDVTVQNQVGLHARPATFFIQKANEFKSSIWVEKEERRVNAKSLLGVLSLGIMGGTAIRIIAGGPDEETAVDELVKLVESGFAE
jgi:phosphocarrier protein